MVDLEGNANVLELEKTSLGSHNIDMLLNLITTKENGDRVVGDDAVTLFDWTQPAKSWWRYFKKQTDQNTAMCYACGAVFNRGPKQSTTSLSHHLKMHHREQFILIQQAKDEDIRCGNKGFNAAAKRKAQDQSALDMSEEEYLKRKKSAFNLSLIESVRQKPELYDGQKRQSDENELWEQVGHEIGTSGQTAKKNWQSLSQRYRKEIKIAVRDNFLYKPKWPYFWDLNFLDEHLKVPDMNRHRGIPDHELHPSYLNGSGNLLNNILNAACSKSPLVDEEGSTDSAIASSEHSGVLEPDSTPEQQRHDAALLTIHQLFSVTGDNHQLDEQVLAGRSRSQKGSFDWLQDEDMLFGKIVALRLRNLAVDQRRQMKIVIEQLFERQERGLSVQQLFDD